MGMVVGCDEGGRRPSAAPNFVRMMPPKPVHLSLSTRLVLQCRSQVSAETHLPERERERESYDCGGHSTPGRGSAAQCVHGAGNQLCGHGTELGSPPALLPHDSQLANLTELRPARMVLGHLGGWDPGPLSRSVADVLADQIVLGVEVACSDALQHLSRRAAAREWSGRL